MVESTAIEGVFPVDGAPRQFFAEASACDRDLQERHPWRLIVIRVPTKQLSASHRGRHGSASRFLCNARRPVSWLMSSFLDRKCFFFVFRLSPSWKPFMTFAQPVDGSVVGREPGTEIYVAPLLWRCAGSLRPGCASTCFGMCCGPGFRGVPELSPEGEWRRDRTSPKECDTSSLASVHRQP